ncbi:rho GTPase-activating protein 33 [Phymastichus coffea]|uniref:rho GTPase-activating protein 33 n=1 Tax=Phymastichus coffea TaxID=108790 RepID=UPI00273A89BC|nr:rho GTPase-activating protein 33 [Phymastichus coffea]
MKRLQRMPGASFERPRVYKLSDIEPHSSKGPGTHGRGSDESAGSPLSSAGHVGSIARFPKLDECAHFHYEHVELGRLEVAPGAEEPARQELGAEALSIRVTSGDACWTLERTHENLVMFDRQLHRCIFDRSFSRLAELCEEQPLRAEQLRAYFERFSGLSHEGLNCGPVLNWLQLDNRGRRILVPEADNCPINTPAVAAAYAVRPYQAQAQDEISFQVGDMISVIDMPPPGESSWWRGKHGFAVGFFPAECVAVIGDKLPRHLAPLQQQQTGAPKAQPVKPVLRKHGKLIAFFRSFILNRPSRRRLKQSGILRERVFGCDLGEHLLNSAREVPNVLACCAEFIERHGLVDGIYRLSGVSSNIQRLRHAFDEDRVPALHTDEGILRDIHSVASLLKMYFRELPNPLCTYQLYSSFVGAVQPASDAERLARMRDAVRKLPPPHYRTLEYLMRHLVRVAARGEETGMTARNVAIVWAPNLLRCKELEVGGVAALQGVGVQAVVTEFLICYAELIFAAGPLEGASAPEMQRPKSLAIAANSSSRLLSLEEARSRSVAPEPALIEVGAGSAGLPQHYHTVIELPAGQRKRHGSKRSPSLNWRALFGGGRGQSGGSQAKARSTSASEAGPAAVTGGAVGGAGAPTGLARAEELGGSLRRLLRPVKSADSLDGAASAAAAGSEDALGPLLLCGPSAGERRACGHSRSVSHDSYFEHLGSGDAASAASGLDLSEIQLNFELEEREMRILSEGTAADSARQSLEASPRRQRAAQELPDGCLPDIVTEESTSAAGDAPAPGGSGGGGSKRKRSRLEERLQCDVDLRFIDSQSPDQVMVTADVHDMETPSPLPTPGYLPLLSEASTPLTPNASPVAVSPRISFKSFALPLHVDERFGQATKSDQAENVNLLRTGSTKSSKERDSSSSSCQPNEEGSAMDACETAGECPSVDAAQQQHLGFTSPSSIIVDQEMRPCEKLSASDTSSQTPQATYQGLHVSPSIPNSTQQAEKLNNLDNTFVVSELTNQTSGQQSSVSLSSQAPDSLIMTDLDSLMPYEQSYDDSLHSNVDSIDSQDKVVHRGQPAENWLITGNAATSLDSLEEGLLVNRASNSNSPKILAAQEYVSSSTIANKDCQELMCYSSADEAYHNESSDRRLIPAIEPSSNKSNSKIVRSVDSNVIDETISDKLISFEIQVHSVNVEPLEIQNPPPTASIANPNSDSLKNYESNQIKNCSFNWKLLGDQNSNETNQSKQSQECRLNSDPNNQFSDNDNCENIAPNTEAIYEQKHKSTEQNNGEESKKPFNANNQRLFEQVSNSNNFNYSRTASCHLKVTVESNRAQNDIEPVVPADNAAVEPEEMARVPEMHAENNALNSSCNYSPLRYGSLKRGSNINKDTASILQELALQRLSGGDSVNARRRYDSDSVRDRRSFDSEIGREIVREHKMKQELEHARVKFDESLASGNNQNVPPPSHLPPCLRARHARATRAALSRSLDEAKFNKMTNTPVGEYLARIKQDKSENSKQQQHASTPNVGDSKSSLQLVGASERSSHQSLNKNLGLDLDDPRCRERIEKYKEERRTFLRDKYRSESFRAQVSPATSHDAKSSQEDGEQALLARLKQRTSRPSLL